MTGSPEQWGMVGDVFVVGCALPDSCVYPEFNATNSDMQDKRYSTSTGMYEKGCGIDNLDLAWGHDEYLYQVLNNHKANKLPEETMVMIRYHSFYPWHSRGAYTELLSEKDGKYLEIIKDFNKYDLYTKSQKIYDLEDVLDYYQPIAEKYLGTEPIYWQKNNLIIKNPL